MVRQVEILAFWDIVNFKASWDIGEASWDIGSLRYWFEILACFEILAWDIYCFWDIEALKFWDIEAWDIGVF